MLVEKIQIIKTVPFSRAFYFKKISHHVSESNQIFYFPPHIFGAVSDRTDMTSCTYPVKQMTSDRRISSVRFCIISKTMVKNPIPIFYNFQSSVFPTSRYNFLLCIFTLSTLISHFLNPHRLPLHHNTCAYF
jgi:hypothetical protein